MRRLGPFSLEGALLVVGLGVALLGGITCTAQHYAERSARIVALEAQVSEARHRTDSLTRLVDSVTRNVTTRITSNRQVGQRLSERLAANDSLLSTDSADVLTLRVALAQTTEVARLYRDSTEMLHNSVDVMIAAHVTERQAWATERADRIRLEAAQDTLITQGCRVWRIPCPSRVQSVGIGAAGMLLLILL